MNHNKLKLLAMSCFFVTSMLCAQESTNAGGGTATGTTGNASYSVGQLVYTVQTGTSGTFAQGVQQSFEISTTLGIEETSILLEATAFPNPTTNVINLRLKNTKSTGLSYQITDLSGRLLTSKKLISDKTTIAMQQFPTATYFVSVLRNNNIIKTFKIIKK